MTEHVFSVGFRGVFAAWIARRVAMMGLGAPWFIGDGDFVTGPGHPSTLDLLYPERAAQTGDRDDRSLSDEIERLTPHLVRPMRMVSIAPKQPGLMQRLLGAKRDPRERIDLKSHPAGDALALDISGGIVERTVLVDSQRLTVALARDFAAREGTFYRNHAPEAAFNLTDDRQYPENFEPRVAVVMRRRYRHDFAYNLFCEDGTAFITLPLDQDRVLIERAVGALQPDEAMKQLAVAYHAMFGLDMETDDLIEATFHNDGEDFSCAQHLRNDEAFLKGLIKAVALPLGGSDPDRAGLIDGRIEENYGQFANKLAANYSHLDAAYIRALVARHGPLAPDVLSECHRDADLGQDFGGGLREREARWMQEHEFARTASDICFGRGPFALHGADLRAVESWMDPNGSVG